MTRREGVVKQLARQKASAKEKAAAHYTVAKALKDGRLVRQPCELCGSLESDAHHADYSKPLEVRWLCRTAHKLEHSRIERARKHDAARVAELVGRTGGLQSIETTSVGEPSGDPLGGQRHGRNRAASPGQKDD
jgi:hypothetical protein